MDVQRYMQLISGERRGFISNVMRFALSVASLPYGGISRLRNSLFDLGIKRIYRVAVPVISIGNLTTGGTGKTPLVAATVRTLQQQGRRPGIVSRGYKSAGAGGNDEKLVLAKLCPGVPHVQNPDRVAASEQIVREHKVDVIVLDDAFQHRRIHRDVDIVLIDATNPFGFEKLLPRGLLRESTAGLSRADAAIITRTESVSAEMLADVIDVVVATNPDLADRILKCTFEPTSLTNTQGNRETIESISEQDVAVMTAIGNPTAFVESCQRLGANVVYQEFFPDHHHYSSDEVERCISESKNNGASLGLTTLKDLVKLPEDCAFMKAVEIEARFSTHEDSRQFQEILSSVANANQ